MSLLARTALYFKYAVAAKFKLAPAPINVEEVKFIYDSFGKLGTVEYFKADKAKHTDPHLFEPLVTVLLNPTEQFSQIDPLSGVDSTIALTGSELRQKQGNLRQKLQNLIGLPRFSYVENDKKYFGGEVQVPFKHSLLPRALHLEYKMSTSTISSPFVYLEEGNPAKVAPQIRHNFQKYHKFQPLFVETGLHGLHLIGAGPLDTSVKVSEDAVVRTEDIMRMDKSPNMLTVRTKDRGFHGFFAKQNA